MAVTLDHGLSVSLGDPVVVAMSEPGESRWGYHQFPKMSWLPAPKPRLLLTYNICGDDDLEYGRPGPAFTSDDLGRTWQPFAPPPDAPEALLTVSHSPVMAVNDGDFLCTPFPPGHAADELPAALLDNPVAEFHSYAKRLLVRVSDCPPWVRDYLSKVAAVRYDAAQDAWMNTEIDWPTDQMLLRVWPGSSFVRTSFEQPLARLGGELFCADYKSFYYHADGQPPRNMETLCMVSRDNGRSFEKRSIIAADPTGRDIMGEGSIIATAEGELVCVIRRLDHEIKGMVITRSRDAGHTWERYQPLLGDFGVLPYLQPLNCGVLALAYGRPGVWLALSPDGAGHTWTRPVPIIEGCPGDKPANSCGYTNMLAIDDNVLLLAYSDWRHVDADGRSRKAICVRTIEVDRT